MPGHPRPLEVMVVQAPLDPELPLYLAARLRSAMTVHALSHGAQALARIDAGARFDIILLDRRTSDIDPAAIRRLLGSRVATSRTSVSFLDDGHTPVRSGHDATDSVVIPQPHGEGQTGETLHHD